VRCLLCLQGQAIVPCHPRALPQGCQDVGNEEGLILTDQEYGCLASQPCPGSQVLDVSAEYTKLFLTVFEHPPDAHRGFDIPSAIVTFLRDGVCRLQISRGQRSLDSVLSQAPGDASHSACIHQVRHDMLEAPTTCAALHVNSSSCSNQ